MFAARASALTTKFQTGAGASASFVTLDSSTGNLMLDGQRFRFSGANAAQDIGSVDAANGNPYGVASVDSNNHYLTPHAQIDAYLNKADAMGATVVRAFAAVIAGGSANTPQPSIGVYNDAALDPIDYALSRCAALGIRMTAPFCGNLGSFGSKYWYCNQNGVTPDTYATQFFTNTTVVNSFKAYITHVLNHVNPYTGIALKDDPMILAWETGNELETGSEAEELSKHDPWTETIGIHVKETCGAQQLFINGRVGFSPDGVRFDTTALLCPHVDIHNVHTYDNFRNPAHIESLGRIAHQYGKALYVGEYPTYDKDFNGFSLNWTLTDLLSMIEPSPWIDGDDFWDLLGPGVSWGDGFTVHHPGDNPTMIARVTQLTNHANAMPGTNPARPPKIETLTDTFATLDTTTKWSTRGSPSITSGQLWIPGGSGVPGIYSKTTYDLIESSMTIELVDANPSTGQSLTGIFLSTANNDAGTSLGFVILGHTTMSFRQTVGGTVSETTEGYSTTNHRWLRLRESKGSEGSVIVWDTSDDGVHWTPKRSRASGLTPIQLTKLYVLITVGPWGTDGTPGTAKLDNFNNPPIPTPSLPPIIYRPNYGALLQV